MDLNFQTANGDRIVRVHDADGLVRALDSLTDESTAEIETGAYPPLYASGVRYQRERGEHWRSPARVVSGPDAYGADCEDLTAWRVAELRASGADPDARPALYPTSKRSYHAVVVRGDGSIEDPSALLGMRIGVPKIGVKFAAVAGGRVATVGLRLADGSILRSVGVGACGMDALASALDHAYPMLADMPSVTPRVQGWTLRRGPFHVGAADVAADAAAVRAAAEAARANPTPENAARLAAVTRDAVESTGGHWESYAKKAVESGCKAAADATGAGAVLSPLCDLIGPIWDAIKDAFTITVYPSSDFMRWSADKAGVTGADAEPSKLEDVTTASGIKGNVWTLVNQKIMAAGYLPIFFNAHNVIRDRVRDQMTAFGWPPAGQWSKQYGEWYTPQKEWRFGTLWKISDMTGDALKLAAAGWGTPADRAAVASLRTKAKAIFDAMKPYSDIWAPGLGGIDSAYWGVYGVFPKMPGSRMPQWMADKLGTAPVVIPERAPGDFGENYVPTTAPLATIPAPAGGETAPPAPGPVPLGTPPVVDSTVSDFVRAAESLVAPGRSGDWLALARLAETIERGGSRSTFARMARAMLR